MPRFRPPGDQLVTSDFDGLMRNQAVALVRLLDSRRPGRAAGTRSLWSRRAEFDAPPGIGPVRGHDLHYGRDLVSDLRRPYEHNVVGPDECAAYWSGLSVVAAENLELLRSTETPPEIASYHDGSGRAAAGLRRGLAGAWAAEPENLRDYFGQLGHTFELPFPEEGPAPRDPHLTAAAIALTDRVGVLTGTDGPMLRNRMAALSGEQQWAVLAQTLYERSGLSSTMVFQYKSWEQGSTFRGYPDGPMPEAARTWLHDRRLGAYYAPRDRSIADVKAQIKTSLQAGFAPTIDLRGTAADLGQRGAEIGTAAADGAAQRMVLLSRHYGGPGEFDQVFPNAVERTDAASRQTSEAARAAFEALPSAGSPGDVSRDGARSRPFLPVKQPGVVRGKTDS